MKYKTIYGLKFYGKIYDLDTQQHFKVTNGRWFGRCGWFLLKREDNNEWTIVKYVWSSKYHAKESYNNLPYFKRLGLFKFLRDNFKRDKCIQSILDNIHLLS